KGGVGKTTIDFHWLVYLVEQGYRVLGIDLDSQATSPVDSRLIPAMEAPQRASLQRRTA
ncbi:hypothetical protein D8N67_19840, partial [Acinetobacter baumannii]